MSACLPAPKRKESTARGVWHTRPGHHGAKKKKNPEMCRSFHRTLIRKNLRGWKRGGWAVCKQGFTLVFFQLHVLRPIMQCIPRQPSFLHLATATAFSLLWLAGPAWAFVFALACYYCLSCLSITQLACHLWHWPSYIFMKHHYLVGCGAWQQHPAFVPETNNRWLELPGTLFPIICME